MEKEELGKPPLPFLSYCFAAPYYLYALISWIKFPPLMGVPLGYFEKFHLGVTHP